MSAQTIGGSGVRWAAIAASSASARICCQAASASGGSVGQRSKPNRRRRPGAIPRAASACSIANVPDPAIGSTNGRSARAPPSASTAAASVSFSGASTIATR